MTLNNKYFTVTIITKLHVRFISMNEALEQVNLFFSILYIHQLNINNYKIK